jgi:hypothetical protein
VKIAPPPPPVVSGVKGNIRDRLSIPAAAVAAAAAAVAAPKSKQAAAKPQLMLDELFLKTKV